MSELVKFPRVIILLLLISFATVTGLLFTPALPEIAAFFQISESKAQWVMSVFMIGYTLGQLPYGPIANRYGRKRAIAIGFALAVLGSFISYMAAEFWILCVGRFIQAVGSGVGLTIVFTIVGDIHAGKAVTKAISLLTLAFGLMPGIATAIGGYITVLWGWQSCFLSLTLYSILLWLLCMIIPETAKQLHPDALELHKIWHGISRQFRDPYLTLHALLMSFTTTIMYIVATISPYIGINRIGLSAAEFGLWSMLPSFGLVIGALVSQNLADRFSPRINMLNGILLEICGALILALAFANQAINVWTLFPPLFVMYIGGNLIWSTSSSQALSEATDKSNSSAVIQFINLGMATIGVFLIEVVPPTTTMLLPISFAILIVLMFVFWLGLKAHHKAKKIM